MDNLDRQPGEKFHTWAHRIHNRYQDYLGYSNTYDSPYPKSRGLINKYIECIRNKKKCYDCGEYILIGQIVFLNWHMDIQEVIKSEWKRHRKFCYYIPQKRINAVITLQQAWRRRRIEHNCKIRFLQKKILAWLYQPGRPMMKNAEKHYYQIAITQGPTQVNSQ